MKKRFKKGHFKKIRADLNEAAKIYLMSNVKSEMDAARLVRRLKAKDNAIRYCSAMYWKCIALSEKSERTKDLVLNIINDCVNSILEAKSDTELFNANELMKVKIKAILDLESLRKIF